MYSPAQTPVRVHKVSQPYLQLCFIINTHVYHTFCPTFHLQFVKFLFIFILRCGFKKKIPEKFKQHTQIFSFLHV